MSGGCWFVDQNDEFVVALTACNHDGKVLVRNLNWMQQLDGKIDYDCVIAEDAGIKSDLSARIRELASSVFRAVQHFQYPTPKIEKWPHAPNWAFQSTARHMQGQKRPWLWMEPDMVPLKRNWCRTLQLAYRNCGQPMMGSFIEGKDHMNGTAIYPHYFPEISPDAMAATDVAWDFVMRHDTMPFSYNAVHLMFHCWGIINGAPHAYTGNEVKFQNEHQLRTWIPKTAVTFHRCKDASLIALLTKQLYANSNLHPVIQ